MGSMAIAKNPHWVGNDPAWDIVLTNGIEHKSVTKSIISTAHQKLKSLGVIGYYDAYIDVVREINIQNYNKLHTSNLTSDKATN